jgi:hypothetical protein
MDDDIESTLRNANMDFLDPTKLEMSTESAGGDFDDLFARTTTSRPNGASGPSKPYQDQNPLRPVQTLAADSPAESPDDSGRSSSSESPRNHLRQTSIASTNSAAHSENPLASTSYPSEDWMRPELSSVKEESPFNIDPSFPMDGGFSMDPDLEVSNKAMDAAFDFESAASSPSPLKTDNGSLPRPQKRSKSQLWSPSSNHAALASVDAVPSVSRSNGILVCREMLTNHRFMPPGLRSSLLDLMANPHIRPQSPKIWIEWLRNGVDTLLRHF